MLAKKLEKKCKKVEDYYSGSSMPDKVRKELKRSRDALKALRRELENTKKVGEKL